MIQREYGPFHTDEDLLLAALFVPEVLENLRREQRARSERESLHLSDVGSVADLVSEASRVMGAKHVRIVQPG